MIHTTLLSPGVTLRCIPDGRFKHGCLSLQLLRPMGEAEAAMNALLPAVLLRGCKSCPDLRSITLRLDDLYGAGVGTLVRRVGDWQTTGFYCSFTEDRYAMAGDAILEPLTEFVRQLLLEPVLEDGIFRDDYVQSEKKNLIATIESQLNDKRAYAMDKLLRQMCRGDSFGIPRLGRVDKVAAITARELYDHYQQILRTSQVHLFYVGSAAPERVAALLKPLFADLERQPMEMTPQTPFRDVGGDDWSGSLDVNQGKLCMGLVTPITVRDPQFVALQLRNLVFGGGMTSKLFMKIREELSLCYAIGSGYHGSKGIMTLSAGIDFEREDEVRQQILAQLEACKRGEITQDELIAAREALCSSLRAIHDSPGAMENYYAGAALSGLPLTAQAYMDTACATTVEELAEAAKTLQLHSIYFLKGVEA